MRIIANENVSRGVIQGLRDVGHDVWSVKEKSRGADDLDILVVAELEQRLILTHDKDFGELSFRPKSPASAGVILLRLSGDNPDSDNRRVLEAIASRDDWENHFSVIEANRIRMRPLPHQ